MNLQVVTLPAANELRSWLVSRIVPKEVLHIRPCILRIPSRQ
jgi:hypothetical protein